MVEVLYSTWQIPCEPGTPRWTGRGWREWHTAPGKARTPQSRLPRWPPSSDPCTKQSRHSNTSYTVACQEEGGKISKSPNITPYIRVILLQILRTDKIVFIFVLMPDEESKPEICFMHYFKLSSWITFCDHLNFHFIFEKGPTKPLPSYA